jgi:hypothetical protein
VSPYQPHKHFYVYLRQFLLVLVGRFRLWRSKSAVLLMYNSKWFHYVSTLTVTSSSYAIRMVQHFFSLWIKCKLWYWTLSMFTEK